MDVAPEFTRGPRHHVTDGRETAPHSLIQVYIQLMSEASLTRGDEYLICLSV